MATMRTLRNTHRVVRFVLVWLALSLGAGTMKLAMPSDAGVTKIVGHALDGPLCVNLRGPRHLPPGFSGNPCRM